MKNILIIEDDLIFALDLKIQLSALYPSCEISHLESVNEAYHYLLSTKPDIVLLDVLLDNDEDAMHLAEILHKTGVTYIFMTAFERDDLFRKALRFKPSNYLQKPISKHNLKYALELAVSSDKYSKAKGEIASDKRTLQYLLLKGKEGTMEKVGIDEIIYIEALGNYCQINTLDKRYTYRMPIKNYADTFGDRNFVRIFRTYVVNIDFLRSVNTEAKEVILLNGLSLPLSLTYKKGLLNKFVKNNN
ncbi:MAG: response regulator transcription factor [Saprospiraceae bacterium]